MPEEPCACCASDLSPETGATPTVFPDEPLQHELPDGLAASLGHVFGRSPIRTIAEWIAAIREELGGRPLTREDLCFSRQHTPHVAVVNEEIHHFACFYDGVILAALEESAVEITTLSPTGSIITATADGEGGLHVEPSEAVYSFGIASPSDAHPAGESPHDSGTVAMCPYINAFTDVDEYTNWASGVAVETVAMPLSGATALAEGLVAEDVE